MKNETMNKVKGTLTPGGLYAGATMEEAGKWLTVAGALWGELK